MSDYTPQAMRSWPLWFKVRAQSSRARASADVEVIAGGMRHTRMFDGYWLSEPWPSTKTDLT